MTKGKIVSNSSPIIALSIIDKLSLLNELYSEIFVPGAVYNEIVRNSEGNKIGCIELERAINNGKIHIYNIENTSLVSKLSGRLHEGELEAIVAAKELDLNTVLIDDKDARKMAKTLSLAPLGTIGFLCYAKKQGKIDEIKKHLDILEDRGFRFSKVLYKKALLSVGES